MAAKDNVKTPISNESEDISLETTIPTDFTLSPESDEGPEEKMSLKQQLKRKQLLHDLQLLKIELSHKSLIVENLKAEFMGKVDDLEEKLADALHQKQVLQAKLESKLRIQEDTSKRRLQQTKHEMETILKKQQELEEVNAMLQEKAGDARRHLRDLELTSAQYDDLKRQNVEQLSLRDYVAMKVYDVVWPLKLENEELKTKESRLKDDLKYFRQDNSNVKDNLDRLNDSLLEYKLKYDRASTELAELKTILRDADYKRDNFDRIKSERDRLETELFTTKKTLSNLEASSTVSLMEKEEYKSEVSNLKQKQTLLTQDKEYLSKQVIELTTKLANSDERLSRALSQLDQLKEAREELYERYVTARDKYKNDYEDRLKEEIDKIQGKTSAELEKLRISQIEVHELELRSLREARDIAAGQRDKLESQLSVLKSSYDELRIELKQVQSCDDARMADLRSELKLKTLELERAQMMEAETSRNFRVLQIESEKLQKKLEVTTNEVYEQQNKYEKRIAELEAKISERSVKLEMYEKLEDDLDDIVMHAAEVGDDQDAAERVLFSFGYDTNVPTTAKRRLQQSLKLARRILAVEKLNGNLHRELAAERERAKQLEEEVRSSNELLQQTQQPYNYMIDSIRLKDKQLSQMKANIAELEKNLSSLRQEREFIIKRHNQMTQDLERLLNQRQELNVIKRTLIQLQSGDASARMGAMTVIPESLESSTSVPRMNMDKDLPPPTVFTKKDPTFIQKAVNILR